MIQEGRVITLEYDIIITVYTPNSGSEPKVCNENELEDDFKDYFINTK